MKNIGRILKLYETKELQTTVTIAYRVLDEGKRSGSLSRSERRALAKFADFVEGELLDRVIGPPLAQPAAPKREAARDLFKTARNLLRDVVRRDDAKFRESYRRQWREVTGRAPDEVKVAEALRKAKAVRAEEFPGERMGVTVKPSNDGKPSRTVWSQKQPSWIYEF
jgi:hypothetical protein